MTANYLVCNIEVTNKREKCKRKARFLFIPEREYHSLTCK